MSLFIIGTIGTMLILSMVTIRENILMFWDISVNHSLFVQMLKQSLLHPKLSTMRTKAIDSIFANASP